MNDALIRTLRVDDLDGLLRLYAQLQLDERPAPRPVLATTWQQILSTSSLIYLGLFERDVLASTCHAVIVPNLTHGAHPYAVIENVVTDDAYRRRGHGAAVMRALLERCWARGCYKVMLSSGTRRGPAHAFYEALGFDRGAKQAFVIKRDPGP